MSIITLTLIALVALLHLYFLVLEMFLWTRPLGMKVFRLTREKAESTKVLAANQGLYNGFLAAGLVWSILGERRDVATFFLACVVVAGLYGAATVNQRILIVQSVPALLALVALWSVG
jgi:putative membrane protein